VLNEPVHRKPVDEANPSLNGSGKNVSDKKPWRVVSAVKVGARCTDRRCPSGITGSRRVVAKNTGTGSRKGAVSGRVQALNPVTRRYVKIDTTTGKIMAHKKTSGPFKGVKEVIVPPKKKK
jgi:hypothetical protein